MRLLLEGEGELAEPERRALEVLWGLLADPLAGRWAGREPAPAEREALARLADHYRARQLGAIDELIAELGDLPALRRASGPRDEHEARS